MLQSYTIVSGVFPQPTWLEGLWKRVTQGIKVEKCFEIQQVHVVFDKNISKVSG